jgi:crossover junction endodeoxyribonuclease RusA
MQRSGSTAGVATRELMRFGKFISAKGAKEIFAAEDRKRRLRQPVRHLELTMPPSSNRYWRIGNHGRLYRSDAAEEYMDDCGLLARQQKFGEPIEGNVAISMKFYRARKSGDLDNRIKVLLDALQGIAYADDKQVTELHAYRFDDAKNPRVEVEIAPV